MMTKESTATKKQLRDKAKDIIEAAIDSAAECWMEDSPFEARKFSQEEQEEIGRQLRKVRDRLLKQMK
jgi:hypothetical protein